MKKIALGILLCAATATAGYYRSQSGLLNISDGMIQPVYSTIPFKISTETYHGGRVGIGPLFSTGFRPYSPLHVLNLAARTPGALSGGPVFIQDQSAATAATDIYAGLYAYLLETGAVSSSGNVGHNIAGLLRYRDSANSGMTGFAGELRTDAYGKAPEYYGSLSYVIGTYPGLVSTSTFYGAAVRAQMTSDGATPLSTGTVKALRIEPLVGFNPAARWAFAQDGSADQNYFLGRLAVGVSTPPITARTFYVNGTAEFSNVATFDNVVYMQAVAGNPVAFAGYSGFISTTIAGTTEMRAFDSAGNITTISPHGKFTGEWVYNSENSKTKTKTFVPMMALVRAVEKLTGTPFEFRDEEEFMAWAVGKDAVTRETYGVTGNAVRRWRSRGRK